MYIVCSTILRRIYLIYYIKRYEIMLKVTFYFVINLYIIYTMKINYYTIYTMNIMLLCTMYISCTTYHIQRFCQLNTIKKKNSTIFYQLVCECYQLVPAIAW